jgi:hypothetical protein
VSKSDGSNVRVSTARIERFIKTEGIVISKARVWGESKELLWKVEDMEGTRMDLERPGGMVGYDSFWFPSFEGSQYSLVR